MKINRFYVVTSIFILLVLGYLSYQILKPFFNAIAWAIVFTIVFYPVYTFILRYGRSRFFTLFVSVFEIFRGTEVGSDSQREGGTNA